MLHSSEQYCLAWESKYLMELGSALDTLVNGFVNMMAQEALKFTVLSGKNPYCTGFVFVQFHCWCLFKGAFLIREDFWEGILASPCKSGLRTFCTTPVIQNCFPGLLCSESWTCSFKITAGNTFLHVCIYFSVLLHCVLVLYTNLSNTQVAFMYGVCLPPYRNIRFFLIFSLAKHFSDQLLRKKH